MSMSRPATLGELQEAGYQVLPIKEELRKNLIEKLRKGEGLFPGVIGFDETVIPQIENAILSGHDMIFLGERGQAKSRIIRSLINFLDPEVPVIKGCEVSDNPYRPICRRCQVLLIELGNRMEIDWIPREERYGEKLATPDVSIADLIGEVDPIKVAEGKYLSNELTIHFGLILRTNRGIFAINELPDLAEKVQVGLFNIMEERDIQIKGYRVRLPLDILIVASANPEDYTSRGRIITPLKDRYYSQIKTHYPRVRDVEIKIMEQERRKASPEGYAVRMPQFMKEIIAEITLMARRSSQINQRSGVSVRMSISNYECLVSSAEKRAILLGEEEAVPRISDLSSIFASSTGKIELEYAGEDKGEAEIVDRLIKKGVREIFNEYFTLESLQDVVDVFNRGGRMEVSEAMSSREYLDVFREIEGLETRVKELGITDSPAMMASGIEFILEGLHLHNLLNKNEVGGKVIYRK